RQFAIALLAAALTGCAAAPPAAPPAQPTSPPAVVRSGLDVAEFDPSVRPQDDLFRYVNGRWLASDPIPADRATYGTFEALTDQSQETVRALLETAAAGRHPRGTAEQKIGDFYSSFMDTTRIALLGLKPLDDELQRIDAIRSTRDIYAYLGHAQRLGISQPVTLFVGQDAADASQYLTGVYQGGLTMPDRDYYLQLDPKYAAFRAAFRRYVERLLASAGEPNAAAAAKRIEALETRIANHHWTRVDNRDPVKTYNKKTLLELPAFTPTFDWHSLLIAAGLPAAALDIKQPSYVRELARLIRTTPIDDWRLYFRWRLLDSFAPLLPKEFEDLHFDFHRRTLRGVPAPLPRWRRAVQVLEASIGELIGRLYVEKTFSADTKLRAQALVDHLLQAFSRSIDALDWMSDATKSEAQRKLASITVKIGYPERWRDYTALEIVPGDLIGNVRRSAEFEFQRQANKLGKPVDRSEWLMTPQTVNAYYYPPRNEIVFPAAILRPPFFDPTVDDAVNYGAIGAVIGHEISHAFDDKGRQFDGAGNLRDWWTFDDNARFRQRGGQLVAQFAAYRVLDGRPLNGELTLGENIGDLSGLAVAFKAYQLSLGGRAAPVLDGLTGPQRFFLGWARAWRRAYRDDELLSRLVTDPHAPAEFRANGPVSNLDEFYAAFDVKPGDRLYRAPQERVKIW
ncbi:MAG: M13 family metallopeptidase, partial [Steroidobacteraceae bacterium]|nr:M13 family metallopeptidase [Steroidobacteraceae bacterium]